jgi:hypothetical protein
MLRTGPGNNTAGGVPLTPARNAGGHSQRDTTTAWTAAQQPLGGNAPGAQNVRNKVALRYQNPAGQMHTYQSAPRADQAMVLSKGQNADGNVHPEQARTPVTVPNRFVMPGGQTGWSILREMPYGGRGNGARGAQLSGQRYYATGQDQQFWNAGQGDYGIARQAGGKRPVSFTEPGPWTANFYDTTAEVGTSDSPGTPTQSPQMVYTSPSTGRASNGTGRLA